jgi:hypothetical protein
MPERVLVILLNRDIHFDTLDWEALPPPPGMQRDDMEVTVLGCVRQLCLLNENFFGVLAGVWYGQWVCE